MIGPCRTYLLGATASTIGTTLQAAALGKHLYDITDSEFALGLLGLVEFLPALILLPLTGSAADRFDRRRVAAIALSVEVLTSVLFCLYAAGDPTSAVPIFVIAALFGTARAFAAPSYRSLPPLIAPDGGLPRMIALYSGTWQFGLIVGPAASGFLYDIDPAVPYIVVGGLLRRRRRRRDDDELRRAQAAHARRRAADACTTRWRACASSAAGRCCSAPSPSTCSPCCSAAPSPCCRRSPRIASASATSATAGCARRRGSVPSSSPPCSRCGPCRVGTSGARCSSPSPSFGAATIVLGLTRNYAVAFAALLVLAGADAMSVFIRATIVPLATPDPCAAA